jgi:hypothetical protein
VRTECGPIGTVPVDPDIVRDVSGRSGTEARAEHNRHGDVRGRRPILSVGFDLFCFAIVSIYNEWLNLKPMGRRPIVIFPIFLSLMMTRFDLIDNIHSTLHLLLSTYAFTSPYTSLLIPKGYLNNSLMSAKETYHGFINCRRRVIGIFVGFLRRESGTLLFA